MRDNSWITRRNRGLHVTIRDVDCADFDVEQFVKDMVDWRVNFFSYFVGGYVTTYPTKLQWQRPSPYLNGRDLAGEINDAAHRAGIKTIAMVDLQQVPEPAASAHPEWCAWDERGQPVASATPGIYVACPLGGYQNEYVREMLAEIMGRYDFDCMKFGGGSFGFSRPVCYCPACRESFGEDVPPIGTWDDELRRRYSLWRFQESRKRSTRLAHFVHEIDPEMPVMGNGVCFGDPGWTLSSALDIEAIADEMDAIQVEVQTRNRYDLATGATHWQYLAWPAETGRYMTSVSRKPIWIVASYFLAWPWRRSAVPAAEQKVYLAQAAANGASPMVNLSGGPPAVHEDIRGFAAVRDLYRFLERHNEYYEGDESAATVAVVFSLDTMAFYGTQGRQQAYLESLRGVEKALDERHVPFDVVSAKRLEEEPLPERYRALVLPSLACLSDAAARAIREFAARGGGVVATFEAGRYDERGVRRSEPALASLLGVKAMGDALAPIDADQKGPQQVYAKIVGRHPLLDGIEGTSLLPFGGQHCPVTPVDGSVVVPLTLSAPFVVFPEGLSYPTEPDPESPLALVRESDCSRVVYLPGQLDLLYWRVHFPDHGRLLANAVRWAGGGYVPLRVEAPSTLQVSLRAQGSRRMVHLVNLTAGERLFDELIPLSDVRVSLPIAGGQAPSRAWALAAGVELPIEVADGWATVVVDRVVDYEVLVVE